MNASALPAPARRRVVGTVSLLLAVGGAIASGVALRLGPLAGAAWLQVVAAGFEAAVVGGLADWFAVTALFRHPLGLPIPHTAIIPARRGKIIESIVSMVEDEWLSPAVIGARLQRLSPSAAIVEWLEDPVHVARVGAPLRDFLASVTRLLVEPEVVGFLDRAARRQLLALPIDASVGRWLGAAAAGPNTAAIFEAAARSVAALARQPATAERMHVWLEYTATALRQSGRRLVPLLLRRKAVQRALVDAGCDYVSLEMQAAAERADHPLRVWVFAQVTRFADRLASGDRAAIAQIEQVRQALVRSLEAESLIRAVLTRLQAQLEEELGNQDGALADLVDRQLRAAILAGLRDPAWRDGFDHWVRATADDLLRRHHNQIGCTVREHLEALETDALVALIEARVGADLQFIRLNGAMVGGLIGVALAMVHRLLG